MVPRPYRARNKESSTRQQKTVYRWFGLVGRVP